MTFRKAWGGKPDAAMYRNKAEIKKAVGGISR